MGRSRTAEIKDPSKREHRAAYFEALSALVRDAHERVVSTIRVSRELSLLSVLFCHDFIP